MLEAFSLAGGGVSVAAMKALSWGLRMAKEAARTQGVFLLFLYRNHTHKTSHFLTKKKIIYIYNIYISLMLRKSVGCAKVPCVPSSSGRLPGGSLPSGLLECFLLASWSRAVMAVGAEASI